MFHLPTSALVVAGLLIGGAAVADNLTQSSGASNFVAITPCRLADTRPSGPQVGSRGRPLGQLEEVSFTVRGTNGDCTIPSTATAVNVNITTLNGSATSHLRAYPTGTAAPNSSINNWMVGQGPTPNGASLALSAAGELTLRNQAGTVDVIVDVLGFYEPDQQPAAAPAMTVPPTTTPAQITYQGGTSVNVPYYIPSTSTLLADHRLFTAPSAGSIHFEYQGSIYAYSSATEVSCYIGFNGLAYHPGIFPVHTKVEPLTHTGFHVFATTRVPAGPVTAQLYCDSSNTAYGNVVLGGPQWHYLFVSGDPAPPAPLTD